MLCTLLDFRIRGRPKQCFFCFGVCFVFVGFGGPGGGFGAPGGGFGGFLLSSRSSGLPLLLLLTWKPPKSLPGAPKPSPGPPKR